MFAAQIILHFVVVAGMARNLPSHPVVGETSGSHASLGRFSPHDFQLISGRFSRIHAVGQASRLSLTLNDRLEALFCGLVGSHQKVRGDF
jgi:hypothetical protein